jgi:hypothetical protein
MRGLLLGCSLPDNGYNRLSIVPDAFGSRMGPGGVGHLPENECLLAMSMAAGLAGLAGAPGSWGKLGDRRRPRILLPLCGLALAGLRSAWGLARAGAWGQ